MRVSRPIKITDELFEALRARSEARGISMQQALSDRLAEHRQQVDEASLERQRLQDAVTEQEKLLTEVRHTGSNHQSAVRKLQAEREELVAMIEEAEVDEAELVRELEETRTAYDEISSASQIAEGEREKLRKQRDTMLSLVAVLGVLAIGAYCVRRFFPLAKPKEPAVPSTSQVVPSWYP
jgi:chromosome segregation ATPase